jgi:hypothetical protein
MRAQGIFPNEFKLICPVQPRLKKDLAFLPAQITRTCTPSCPI